VAGNANQRFNERLEEKVIDTFDQTSHDLNSALSSLPFYATASLSYFYRRDIIDIKVQNQRNEGNNAN